MTNDRKPEPKKYEVTRKFTGGILVGLTHTAVTTVKFQVGFSSNGKGYCAGSPYVITEVKELA